MPILRNIKYLQTIYKKHLSRNHVDFWRFTATNDRLESVDQSNQAAKLVKRNQIVIIQEQ